MLCEIYIDNFKCLTDFRVKPGGFQLWMGDNGTGKSSILEVLMGVQRFLRGTHIGGCFFHSNLAKGDKQSFGLALLVDGAYYEYALIIQYQDKQAQVCQEELKHDGIVVCSSDGKDACYYGTFNSSKRSDEGHHTIVKTDGLRLSRFLDEIYGWLFVRRVNDFDHWYRSTFQSRPCHGDEVENLLADVLLGFERLGFRNGELVAMFSNRFCNFADLSDGQRQLIMLYTYLEVLRSKSSSTIFIDGPGNFVSLREVQPWLGNLQEICDDEDKQAIIISHHPEIINPMARGKEAWFSKDEEGKIIVGSLRVPDGMTPAETVARGWEND